LMLSRLAEPSGSDVAVPSVVVERLLALDSAEELDASEAELVPRVLARMPLDVLTELGVPLAQQGSRLITDLDSPHKARHEAVVNLLLEQPHVRFDPAVEVRLGAGLIERAIQRGLLVVDAKDWLSATELLTVPYLRNWPVDRIIGALARVLVDAGGELRAGLGVLGQRLLAAAAVSGQLEDLLARLRAHLPDSRLPAEPERLAVVVKELRDCAALIRDKEGVINGFVDWLEADVSSTLPF
jgi:hypothetical protein